MKRSVSWAKLEASLPSRLSYGLSCQLWLVVFGIFLNYLGYGAILPFEVIYLHSGRGFRLNVAGLVVGLIIGMAILASPMAGRWIDRFGARVTATAAGLALAAGYAGLAFAHTPAQAFAAALAGLGNGALGPSQATLLTVLSAPEIRHRVTAVSRVASNAGIRLGGQLGGLVVGFGLNGFIVLFLTNALTYLAYVLILVTIVRKDARPEPSAGGYRAVLRDRPFIHLAITNMIIIAVGWGAFTWLLPPYAQKQVGLSPQQIGSLLLANAITVVVLQVSVARFAEGRRRVVIMALAGAIFSLACLLVVAAGLHPGIAYPVLVAAAIVVGTGKCFHTSVLILLVADLAPASLRGRFMAAIGLSWWAGLALAPSVGMRALSLSLKGAFLAAALLVTMAAVSAFALAPGLPAAARVTPHPGGRGVSVSSTKP